MLRGLLAQEVGAENRAKLTQLLALMDTFETHQVLAFFPVCRLEKCYDQEKFKVVLVVGDPDAKVAVRSSFVQVGGVVTFGQALPGYLEEEISSYVEMLA